MSKLWKPEPNQDGLVPAMFRRSGAKGAVRAVCILSPHPDDPSKVAAYRLPASGPVVLEAVPRDFLRHSEWARALDAGRPELEAALTRGGILFREVRRVSDEAEEVFRTRAGMIRKVLAMEALRGA